MRKTGRDRGPPNFQIAQIAHAQGRFAPAARPRYLPQTGPDALALVSAFRRIASKDARWAIVARVEELTETAR
jgi:hypothetical protein